MAAQVSATFCQAHPAVPINRQPIAIRFCRGGQISTHCKRKSGAIQHLLVTVAAIRQEGPEDQRGRPERGSR
jgi:hypothetical protein